MPSGDREGIKGLYVKQYGKIPPYTHNLMTLCNDLGFMDITEQQKDFLAELNPLNVKARYLEVKEKVGQILNKKKAFVLLKTTKELYRWLKSKKKLKNR